MNHLSLFELNEKIKNALSKNLEPSYWVIAEIGELRINQKGHCYLELIEKKEEQLKAKVKATIWAYTFRNLSTWFVSVTGQELSAGMKILANVQVNYHELYGFSLNIRDIDPRFTLGEKERKRQEVINQLIEDGVFSMNKSLPLPSVPQRVAVISSPTAAGYEDFSEQLINNQYGYQFHLKLFKAIMQGPEAVESLIQAMHRVNQQIDSFDLLVIIRGGGSRVDFDCYDHYEVVSHLAQFPIPVITGIGHDRDESIADMVAHTKLKTPTAVSEFLIFGLMDFESKMIGLQEQVIQLTNNRINLEKEALNNITRDMNILSKQILSKNTNRLNQTSNKIETLPYQLVTQFYNQLALYDNSINLLDPVKTLKRGYTVTTYQGKLLKNLKDIKQGSKINTRSSNFELESIVETTKRSNEV